MQAGFLFCFCLFFAGGGSILNSNQHVWQCKEELELEAMLCEIHVHDFKSIFLPSLKQQQNLMKVMFSCVSIFQYDHIPRK